MHLSRILLFDEIRKTENFSKLHKMKTKNSSCSQNQQEDSGFYRLHRKMYNFLVNLILLKNNKKKDQKP